MKKKSYLLIILFSAALLMFAACAEGRVNSTPILTERAIYLSEKIETLDHYEAIAFGRPFFIEDQIFISHMTMGLRFEDDEERLSISLLGGASFTETAIAGERRAVGIDIFYGEDFFSVPVFGITVGDTEHAVDAYLAIHPFERSVDFVQIHAIDIIDTNTADGIRLLASLFVGEETPALYVYQLVPIIHYGVSGQPMEQKIDPLLLGGEQVLTLDAWFDADGNALLMTTDMQTQTPALIVLDPTLTMQLAHLEIEATTILGHGVDERMWTVSEDFSQGEVVTLLRALDPVTWEWIDGITLPLFGAIGLHAAPEGSEFAWFVYTEQTLYGVTEEGVLVQYLDWVDSDVIVAWDTTILFPQDGIIYVINEVAHPHIERAVTLDVVRLQRAEGDHVDEREILTIGGVDLNDPLLAERVRQFNQQSESHRAVIVDYAQEGGWEGALIRLRTDLMVGEGPDVVLLDMQVEENDISHALKQGGFLADLHPFFENDADFSLTDFFKNVFDLWTNQDGVLSYVAGSIVLNPFWGPSEGLEGFTDFTHAGFLQFLRNAEAQGVPYPAGINFLPYMVFSTMLFADDTFFCYRTGRANFENELFLDILAYAASIPDDRQARWMQAMETGEAFDPVSSFARGEQLLTRMFGMMTVDEFHLRDVSVGGLTPIGVPNAAGEPAFSASAIRRMGIRVNSPNAEAAWDFIRLFLLVPNSDTTIEGLPIRRDLFEAYVSEVMQSEATPELTEERAAVLRMIMEHVTHNSMPNPRVMEIIWEETSPFLAGDRTAEDTARIIQNRVSTYLAERS